MTIKYLLIAVFGITLVGSASAQGDEAGSGFWNVNGDLKTEKESYLEWLARLQKQYPKSFYGSLATGVAALLMVPADVAGAKIGGWAGNFAHMNRVSLFKIRVISVALQAGIVSAPFFLANIVGLFKDT